MTAWHEEPIDKKHDRAAFDCGEEALHDFLRRYARKSHESGGAKRSFRLTMPTTKPFSTSIV